MPSCPKVLVVGTTADYIDWIRRSCPDRALFLTDPLIRQQAEEIEPAADEEILCDLTDYNRVSETLKTHLHDWGLSLDGITSYDCESMELTAVLGRDLSLDYPSVEAIHNCRNKYLSKVLWQQWGISCPPGRPVVSSADAVDFFEQNQGPCVLKPVSGSGSELLLCCQNADECENGFNDILKGLRQRQTHRLYRNISSDHPSILIEAYIEGEEFSCDFILENEQAEVIRLSKKIPDQKSLFGTIRGYVLPASLPKEIDPPAFHQTLYNSAKALGITRAVCMLDFLVRGNEIVLLEMAPRPGGDCLPFVIRRQYGLDILQLNLDFAQHRPIRIPRPDINHPAVGLRVHARQGGILKKIDVAQLSRDPRISEVHLPRTPGHRIRMPPEDYDSWLLGHIIFQPGRESDFKTQCAEISEKVIVEIE